MAPAIPGNRLGLKAQQPRVQRVVRHGIKMAFKAFCTMHAFSYTERGEDDHANDNEVNRRSLVSAAMDKHEREIAQRLMCDDEYAKVLGRIVSLIHGHQQLLTYLASRACRPLAI